MKSTSPAELDRIRYAIGAQELDFIEKVSLHYENVYSVPRIAGRILGLLLIVPAPISMKDIARALSVSHGSVSTNLRLLKALGYVEKLHLSGERTAVFRFLPRSRARILRERISHYQELKQLVQAGQRELGLPEDIARRLDEMVAWSELAIKKFSEFIGEWEQFYDRR